jgi:hypothetical protein
MQANYVERNGAFFLDADEPEELRSTLERQKAELAESRRRLAELGDVDAAEYQRLKEAEAKATRERDVEKGNYEKIRIEDEKAHATALKKAADREALIRGQLEESLVDGELTRAIAAYPGAKVTPLLLGAKRSVKLTDVNGRYRAVVLDEKGEARLKPGAKTTDDYMAPSDLIAEMRNDKEWAGNFPATAISNASRQTTVSSSPHARATAEVAKEVLGQIMDGKTRVS